MKQVAYDPSKFDRITVEITLLGILNMGGAVYYYDKDGVKLLWGPVEFFNTDPMMTKGLFEFPLQAGPVETDDDQDGRYLYVMVRLENLYPTGWPACVQARCLGYKGDVATEIKKELLYDKTLPGKSDKTVAEVYHFKVRS